MNYKLKRHHAHHIRHRKHFGLDVKLVKFGYDLYDPVQWMNMTVWSYIQEGF